MSHGLIKNAVSSDKELLNKGCPLRVSYKVHILHRGTVILQIIDIPLEENNMVFVHRWSLENEPSLN